ARRGLRAQQLTNMDDNLGDFDRAQVERGRRCQTEEVLHDVLQTVQFPAKDFKAAGGLFLHYRRGLGQVLFQQLHVDVERTERIPNLVRETRQQAREQQSLL